MSTYFPEESVQNESPVITGMPSEAPQTTRERALSTGATFPQDNKPKANRIARFTYKDREWEMNCANWTLKTQRLFEQNRTIEGLARLFGEEQVTAMEDWDFIDEVIPFYKKAQEVRIAGK